MTGVTSVILMLVEFEYSVNVEKNVQIKREWLGKNIGAMSTCHIVCEITQIFVSLQVYWTFFLSRQILNENHGGIENMNGLDYHGPFFKQLSILYVFFFNSQIDWMFIILFFHQP